jgi:hypothetical protein
MTKRLMPVERPIMGSRVLGADSDTSIDWRTEPDIEQFRQAIHDLKKQPQSAREKLTALAERGSANSMLRLGWVYAKGIGVEKSRSEAERWYRRAVDAGSIEAAYFLGILYFREFGDVRRSVEAFDIAADLQYTPAINRLAVLHLSGNLGKVDLNAAMRYLQKSSDLGNIIAKRHIGFLYLTGRFGLSKVARAFPYLWSVIVDSWKVVGRDPHSDLFKQ